MYFPLAFKILFHYILCKSSRLHLCQTCALSPSWDNYVQLICILLSFPLEFSVLITSCSELCLLLSSCKSFLQHQTSSSRRCRSSETTLSFPVPGGQLTSHPSTQPWASAWANFCVWSQETRTICARGANSGNEMVSRSWALIKVGSWGESKGGCKAYDQK